MAPITFLGRTDIIQKLDEEVFSVPTDRFGDCLSICGPHGIGKTYLITHMRNAFAYRTVHTEFPSEYCCYLEIPVGNNETLVDFQSNLLAWLAGKLSPKVLRTRVEQFRSDPIQYRIALESMSDLLTVYELLDNQPNRNKNGYDNWCNKIKRCMQPDGSSSVFLNYTNLGFRIILILDEFDRAAKGFPTGDIFQWLFSLSNKSSTGSHLNLSIVLLSRRRVNKIAHHMEDGSNFEDAYPPHPLRGFNNDELAEYFDSYATLPCGIPSLRQRQKIMYLCGRHPGLLMKMRKELSGIKSTNYDVDKIWYNNADLFKTVYEKMCEQLQREKISSRTDATLMDALLYQFEFFATEDEHYDERLTGSGFTTSMSEDDAVNDPKTGIKYYPDIFTLAGSKSIDDSTELLKCEPLSPYFLDYVRTNWRPDQQRGAAEYLEVTERALRIFIAAKLQLRYGTSWKSAAEDTLPNKMKLKFLENLQRSATLNGYSGDISILDVMAFDNYGAIIEKNWGELFEECFAPFESPDTPRLTKLLQELEFLRNCRNTSAHCNIKILNPQHLAHLKDVCDKLHLSIASNTPSAM